MFIEWIPLFLYIDKSKKGFHGSFYTKNKKGKDILVKEF